MHRVRPTCLLFSLASLPFLGCAEPSSSAPPPFFFLDHLADAEGIYNQVQFRSVRKNGALSSSVTMAGETQLSLTPPLPSRFTYEVQIPPNPVLRFSIGAMPLGEEGFDGVEVDVGKVGHRAAGAQQVDGIAAPVAQDAQDGQRHHGRAVDPAGAVDKHFAPALLQRLEGKTHAVVEQVGGLGEEVVVHGQPEDCGLVVTVEAQGVVVKLELGIDDVGDAGAHDLVEAVARPDTAADGQARGDEVEVEHGGSVPVFETTDERG